jgi:hypothetical protein
MVAPRSQAMAFAEPSKFLAGIKPYGSTWSSQVLHAEVPARHAEGPSRDAEVPARHSQGSTRHEHRLNRLFVCEVSFPASVAQ